MQLLGHSQSIRELKDAVTSGIVRITGVSRISSTPMSISTGSSNTRMNRVTALLQHAINSRNGWVNHSDLWCMCHVRGHLVPCMYIMGNGDNLPVDSGIYRYTTET
jgi:hypothetical protein